MTDSAFIPTAYIMRGCPFSFKFLLFISEARLLDKIQLIHVDKAAKEFSDQQQTLAKRLGRKPTFPLVEVAVDELRTESDELIRYFAHKYDVAITQMPVFDCYSKGVCERFIQIYRENIELTEKLQSRPAT